MKKLFLILSLLAASGLNGFCGCNFCDSAPKEKSDECSYAFSVKLGYFYPQECTLRNIFCQCGGKGGLWVEPEFRWGFWKGLHATVSGSWFQREGRALVSTCGDCCNSCCNSCCESNCGSCCNSCCDSCCDSCCNSCCECGPCTKVKIPTLGLGLKYFFDCHDRVRFFLGGGLRVFFYKEENCSCYVQQCVKETRPGVMVNGGVEFNICNGFFADLFVDYNWTKTNLDCCCCCSSQCCDINIGGVVAGVALGYQF